MVCVVGRKEDERLARSMVDFWNWFLNLNVNTVTSYMLLTHIIYHTQLGNSNSLSLSLATRCMNCQASSLPCSGNPRSTLPMTGLRSRLCYDFWVWKHSVSSSRDTCSLNVQANIQPISNFFSLFVNITNPSKPELQKRIECPLSKFQ